MIPLLLYFTAAWSLSCLLCSESYESREHFVTPEKNGSYNECNSLTYFAGKQDQFFVTNSTFYFLPGEHRLPQGINITVQNVSNIKLLGNVSTTKCGQRMNGGPLSTKINCSGHQAGFVFNNVFGLVIQGIEITECGQDLYDTPYRGTYAKISTNTPMDVWSAAVVLHNVTDFRMNGSQITNSHGYGILGNGVFGKSAIESCLLAMNKGSKVRYAYSNGVMATVEKRVHGGNMEIRYNNSCPNFVSYFYINDTNITDGQSLSYASGLDAVLNCPNGGIRLKMNRVVMRSNVGSNDSYEGGGGNFGFELIVFPNAMNSVSLNGCTIENGHSYRGSGIAVSIYIHSVAPSHYGTFELENTRFLTNTCKGNGAGLFMRLYYSGHTSNHTVNITLHKCYFEGNQLVTDTLEPRGGIAVHIVTFKVIGDELHSTPQYMTSFKNCIFQDSVLNHPSSSSGTLYIEEHANVVLENCTIRDNNSTGITAVHSYIHFKGVNKIERNIGLQGGGILLKYNAVILLNETTTLYINNNKATLTGGGIYTQVGRSSVQPPCFFQFDADTLLNKTRRDGIHVYLHNNTAVTGTAVYGGQIDECYFLIDNLPWKNRFLLNQSSGSIFNDVFYYNVSSSRAISSDPIGVCFCENQTAICKNRTKELSITPGETFHISVVVIGQRYGAVGGYIVATTTVSRIINISNSVQSVQMNCTSLTYTVDSHQENDQANLILYTPRSSSSEYAVIVLNIQNCPIGFTIGPTGKCECVPRLRDNDILCTAQSHKIQRPADSWIGYNMPNNSNISSSNSNQIIFIQRCPRLYCNPNKTEIKSYKNHIDQNSQCEFNRQGLLCGQCEHNLSIVFGTPNCRNCQYMGKAAIFGMICGFALAGLMLVAFLLACNFTVTEGTINGFILYANIIEANQDIYFPLKKNNSVTYYGIIRIFIAWLNLDIGAEVCFFNGMTALDKIWLQYIFPVYIWLLAGLLIGLSRRYSFFTRLLKNNGTKVLATLILLSYAKLARAIVVSLSGVRFPSNYAWYYDAHIQYLHGAHIPLFLTAISFIVILLPLTLALLLIKHLPRLTSLRLFRWLNKLKPLFDAYTGPYTDEYRFWVGFQLLIRIILLVCTACFYSDEILLLQIISVCALLLSANYFYGRQVYKKRLINILEAFLLLHLIAWSIMTLYKGTHNLNNKKELYIINFFVGSLFLAFCVTICYHVYQQEYHVRAYAMLRRCFNRVTTKYTQGFTATTTNITEGTAEHSEQARLLANAAGPVAMCESLTITEDDY